MQGHSYIAELFSICEQQVMRGVLIFFSLFLEDLGSEWCKWNWFVTSHFIAYLAKKKRKIYGNLFFKKLVFLF